MLGHLVLAASWTIRRSPGRGAGDLLIFRGPAASTKLANHQIVFASRIPPRLLRTRGLVAESCAVPVWKLSFVLILGHWPHIGPVPGATLGCLWGPGGLPKGARRLPRDNPRRPKPFPWIAFGLPLGAGPPEGGRGPQGDNPGGPKGASRCRGAQFFKKHSKTMSISLRRNVHAVEARSPYWSKEGAGRTRITT